MIRVASCSRLTAAPRRYKSAVDCAAQILKREGPLAFMDGAWARCLTVTPRLTICVLAKDALMPHAAMLVGRSE